MDRIPFIVFGDGPRLSTGLARIALDLTVRLWSVEEELGIRVMQLGVDEPEGWHTRYQWEVYGFQPTMHNFGRNALQQICFELAAQGAPPPIVLAITDPSRVWDLVRPPLHSDLYPMHTPEVTLWGYYPIDAENINGAVGGPAAVTVEKTERLLGYTGFGARVLRRTLGVERPIQHLPHGIDTRTFRPRELGEADPTFLAWERQVPFGHHLIGAVATNQPRKDLALLFDGFARYAATHPAALWLHTDLLTGRAWDVGELVKQCGLRKAQVLASTGYLPDSALAARYSRSDATIAPGLGEGFGYPIVESLACGCPVVAIDYAGGVELIPDRDWLVPPQTWRVESVYALKRPVVNARTLAEVLYKTLEKQREDRLGTRAYCRGAVGYLDWEYLWPRWRSWAKKGIDHELERRRRGDGPGRGGGAQASLPFEDARGGDPEPPGGEPRGGLAGAVGGDPV